MLGNPVALQRKSWRGIEKACRLALYGLRLANSSSPLRTLHPHHLSSAQREMSVFLVFVLGLI